MDKYRDFGHYTYTLDMSGCKWGFVDRNRRATGSIPARGPIVSFFTTAPGYRSHKCIKIHTRNFHL